MKCRVFKKIGVITDYAGNGDVVNQRFKYQMDNKRETKICVRRRFDA